MNNKQRLFIYDRREMGVLILLGVMVALFAFTLGVHLGKRVIPGAPDAAHGSKQGTHQPSSADTAQDQLPNRQEIDEQAKGVPHVVADSLEQAVKEEVNETGVRLDTPVPVELPKKTAETKPSKPNPVENKSAPAPDGKFTLQVGSHRSFEEAHNQLKGLESKGLQAFLRSAEIKGKGRWYRVFVGGYESKNDAERAGTRFRSRNMFESYIVTKVTE